MIRKILLSELDNLKPLLEAFYLEQCTYKEPFNWDYIKSNLSKIVQSIEYLVLVDDKFTCFFMGHMAPNALLPVMEAHEDYVYVLPSKRGSANFLRMMVQFEEWCIDNDIQYINVGVGTGIMNEKVKELYTRFGYTEYYSGFKKEIA